MNVWEFIGLDKDLRKSDKTVQLVKNYEEVSKAKIKPPFMAQDKEDGVFALILILDGEVAIFSRTGKAMTNVSHLEDLVEDVAKRNGTDNVALMAELVCHDCSLEVLSGIVNPNRKAELSEEQGEYADNMRLYFHDMVCIQDFVEGTSETPYYKRLGAVEEFLHHVAGEPFYAVRTKICQTLDGAEEFGRMAIAFGKEGVVIKSANAGWKAGRKNEVATKIVRGVDFDLEVLGIEEGKGKRANMVANLVVRWRKGGLASAPAEELSVDGRFTDEQRIEWFNAPENIIGRVVHVHALQLGSKGSLRLAKVRAFRIDKNVADL